MPDQQSMAKWYRGRIHQKRRQVNVLTIEVGLDAQDKDDPATLSETMKCLDSAIEILEHARELRDTHDEEAAPQAEELMEDLGHSLAHLDFDQACRQSSQSRSSGNHRRSADRYAWALRPYTADDSMRFFE